MQLGQYIQHFDDPNTAQHGLSCSMLRLDLLHPVVSGNKLFKLNFYLKEALATGKKGIITMGGPHSNHLVAAAYAAKNAGLSAIGCVRGEEPTLPSATLEECKQYGMQLVFLTRTDFDGAVEQDMISANNRFQFIPQGGYGPMGMKGATKILQFEASAHYDWIVGACGTGTMGAGLVAAAAATQKVLLVSVLKNNFSIRNEINGLLTGVFNRTFTYAIDFTHHHGGYAKPSTTVFQFMNWFYQTHGIPTDFVYTGKMVHAFYELASEGFFPKKSKILLIHSGGLQGNRSLNQNELIF